MNTFEVTTPLGRAMLALIATIALSSCTERPSAAPAMQSNATTQAVIAPDPATAPQATSAPQDTLTAHTAPGGVPTEYVAYFDAGQLKRIAETRNPDSGDAAKGEYVFYGARLTQYRGAALNSGASIELNFDMQGGLTASNTSAGNTIGDEDVAAIRNRAQLLRSVALARRSTRSHTTH